jgi:hypothetical protein|tara:strand:- start:263 stop:643 length:381 start_codon:yes stop_codon:yes gene_type:complete
MSSSPDEDEEFVPITFEEAADEFTEMSEEAGTLPDGDDIDENIEWSTEQMEYAFEAVEIEEQMAADEEHWDNIERQDAYENSNDGDSSDDGFNSDEENWEAEDMPGDNADEREEAYDNHDWDAADG